MSQTQRHLDAATELIDQARRKGPLDQNGLLLLAVAEIGRALVRQIHALREDLSRGASQ